MVLIMEWHLHIFPSQQCHRFIHLWSAVCKKKEIEYKILFVAARVDYVGGGGQNRCRRYSSNFWNAGNEKSITFSFDAFKHIFLVVILLSHFFRIYALAIHMHCMNDNASAVWEFNSKAHRTHLHSHSQQTISEIRIIPTFCIDNHFILKKCVCVFLLIVIVAAVFLVVIIILLFNSTRQWEWPD